MRAGKALFWIALVVNLACALAFVFRGTIKGAAINVNGASVREINRLETEGVISVDRAALQKAQGRENPTDLATMLGGHVHRESERAIGGVAKWFLLTVVGNAVLAGVGLFVIRGGAINARS